jgi:integrase
MSSKPSTPRRHPEKALTAVRINTLKKPGRYADGNGLYLVVDPSGAKRWVLRTVVMGRRRDIGLGSLRLVSLAEAREQATAYRKLARSGGDPLADRKTDRRRVPTFEEAARTTHAEHRGAWRDNKHAAQWITTLSTYAFPVLGKIRVDEINTSHVLSALSPIWLTKPETARRTRHRIRTVLDWAKAAGLRSGENPAEGIERGLPRQPNRRQHLPAIGYVRMPEFVRRLREAEGAETARLAFEFLILTATRTSEVLHARWEEVDLERAVWTIPARRTKSGREHRVPLSARAVHILQRARELNTGDELVFPGTKAGSPMAKMTFLLMLRRLNVKNVTAHGFRSAFRDWAAETTSFPREVCEMALAHSISDKTEAAYRRGDLFEKRRELMDAWTDFIHLNSASSFGASDLPQQEPR